MFEDKGYKWVCDICDKEVTTSQKSLPHGWSEGYFRVTHGWSYNPKIQYCSECYIENFLKKPTSVFFKKWLKIFNAGKERPKRGVPDGSSKDE